MSVPRSQKLARLVGVQRQMEKMVEMDLAAILQERADIAAGMDAIVAAMSSDNAMHHDFSRLYAMQLGALKLKDQQLAGRSRLLQQKLLGERAKADRLGERRDDAARQEERGREDQAVYDIIESIGGLGTQASGKFRSS
jgi:hypothetical protein